MYVQGFVLAVPEGNKDAYREVAEKFWDIVKDYGCLSQIECWEADIKDGTTTDFRMAVKAEPGEKIVFAWTTWPNRATADASMNSLIDGIEMTEREMQRLLAKHGVKPIEAEGQKFDPHKHQAMFEVPDPTRPEGTVVQVVQAGFAIGEEAFILRGVFDEIAKKAFIYFIAFLRNAGANGAAYATCLRAEFLHRIYGVFQHAMDGAFPTSMGRADDAGRGTAFHDAGRHLHHLCRV